MAKRHTTPIRYVASIPPQQPPVVAAPIKIGSQT
jgi:hypothetical protein